MKHVAIVVALLPLLSSAALDRIDADGVTEVGGTSAYARMLPRTGSDGRLSSTLLPPVADWASTPIPGLYYVSGSATTQGNGSPQYPFNTFTYALSKASRGSAILFTPYNGYSGTMSLESGKDITLAGSGRSTYFSSISASVSGSSSATEIRICGARVGTLTISGGTVNIRLCNATIDQLTANAAARITVTRSDMGSYVSAATVSYTDVYTGYDTAPKSRELVGGGSRSMAFSGDRVKVGTETVAYVSEVNAATGAVHTVIAGLRAEDARIVGLVETETDNRVEADSGLADSIEATESTLRTEIASIGTTWGSQLSALSTSLGNVSRTLSNLAVKETNDVATLTASISTKASTTYVNTTAAGLRDEFNTGIGALRDDIPAIANECADNRIALATNRIVRMAVNESKAYTDTKVSTVSSRVASLESWKTTATSQIDKNAKDITSLNGAVSAVDGDLKDFKTTEASHIATVNSTITTTAATLRGEFGAADTALGDRITAVDNKFSNYALKTDVSDIADARAIVQINNKKQGIIDSAVSTAGANASTQISTAISTYNTSTVSPISSTVSTHSGDIVSIKQKINAIIDCLSAINEGKAATEWKSKIPGKFSL